MRVILLLLLLWGVCAEVQFGIATVGTEEYCVAYRSSGWTADTYTLHRPVTYTTRHCGGSVAQDPSSGSGYTRVGYDVITVVESDCDVNNTDLGRTVMVRAPFSAELQRRLEGRYFHSAVQVRGDIARSLTNRTLALRPVQLGGLYWGAVVMYFFSLVYVSVAAVLIEAGRGAVSRHAPASPLARVRCTQTRGFLILFLVLFFVLLTVAFTGYFLKPILFQRFFALFLAGVGVVGFYHAAFPLLVLLAVRRVRGLRKTYWLVERTSVVLCGCAIFGLWVCYRTRPNIWPLQLLLLGCVAAVPLRYAPVNCLTKVLVFTLIGVFFSVLQRWVLPAVAGQAPFYVDIVTLEARLKDTISPAPLFAPDAEEPSMMAFRVPLFGNNKICSPVLDGTFGMTNFILPALFMKAAMVTDSALPGDLFFKNYTVGVLSYLLCHIAVFVWSFATAAPVNSNLVYLPGMALALVLNSLRLGVLRKVFPPPAPTEPAPGSEVVAYKVPEGTAEC